MSRGKPTRYSRLATRFALAAAILIAAAARADDPPPPSASDTIVVTATRTPTRLGDTPASIVALPAEAIAVSAAPTLDDALRQVPGFSLFRRTGSRTANPTSQGVSLRGVGASGASRAAVLDDGIPLNDPFGGWVYWGRVPRASLDRVEVLRGGASSLYGSSAMGGVVQFIRRDASKPAVTVEATAGSERTATMSLFASATSGAWRGSVAGDFLTTDGYVLVPPDQRGPVDVEANARHTGGDATIERATDAGRLFVRASQYRESRENGTPLQTNDTMIRQLAAGGETTIARGLMSVRAYGSTQHYEQTFSAIAADRRSERLTVDQLVPSRAIGGSGQWMRNSFVAGAEVRQVSGASNENQTSRVEGRQRTSSVFAEETFDLSANAHVTASLRYDAWRNDDAARNGIPLADRGDSMFSPRLSLLAQLAKDVDLIASAYRAFRAPTLNELYRSFRVGNVLTTANESLGPERMTGVEVGVRARAVRATLFWMTTDDTIANVTLSTTPSLITRQRRNHGTSRSRGLELEADRWLTRRWRVSAGYLLSDATVSGGKRVPQVPRHQATLQATYAAPRITLAMQARWSARQFDDDLNQFPLRPYYAADVFASHPLTASLALTAAIENVTNRRIEAGATPVITLGQPRAARVGVRYTR